MRTFLFVILVLVAGCDRKEPPPVSPMPAPNSAAVPIPDGPGSPQAALRDYSSSVANADAHAIWNSESKEFRDKTDAQLQTELGQMREDFFLRRFTADPKRIQNPGKFQNMRKSIARALTVVAERKRKGAK